MAEGYIANLTGSPQKKSVAGYGDFMLFSMCIAARHSKK